MDQQLFKPTGAALISEGHRYFLTREWDETKPKVLFIGLNPSRANDTYNDATIMRCITFAKDWGYGGFFFGNLYSFRTPYVNEQQKKIEKQTAVGYLKQYAELFEEEFEPLIDHLHEAANKRTDHYLQDMISKADKVIVAWGSWKFTKEREKQVLAMIDKPYCLGVNKDGSPKHPLYLAKTTVPVPF